MLPLEILLHILSLLPLPCFAPLYQVFPAAVVDEALRKALWSQRDNALVDLVSTNLCELAGPNTNDKNESWIPLYLATLDVARRLVWLQPKPYQYYFKVEDAYVSHGKLIMRRSSSSSGSVTGRRTLASLWDIRKQLPPARAGTFSGASEFVRHSHPSQPLTIHDKARQCLLDACLTGGAGHRLGSETTNDPPPSQQQQQQQAVHAPTDRRLQSDDANDPPRPALHPGYVRQAPAAVSAWSARDPCGYVLVEQVAVSVPVLLELFASADKA